MVLPEHTGELLDGVGVAGVATIVMFVFAVAAGQDPEAEILFVTVYVPGEVAETSTTPLELFTIIPEVEENTPAEAPPLKTGDGSDAL